MPWAKGQSGNPGGRPKSKPITDAILRELRVKAPNSKQTHLQVAVARMVALAMAGEVTAFKELANRVEGLPAQPHEVTGTEGGPIEFTIEIARASPDAEEPDASNG